MKKAIILPITTLILVCILALCMVGGENAYVKKKRFSSVDEIVNVLNTSPLSVVDIDGTRNKQIYSDDFYECLSKRKRLTDPGVSWKTVNLTISEDFSDKEKKDLIETYVNQVIRMKKYKMPENIQAVNLKGTYVDVYDPESIRNYEVNVIFIDEGEGLVIDGFYPKRDYLQNDNTKNRGEVNDAAN